MFISLDGIDGAGKSTQISLLRDWLIGLGHDVVLCRDPGSTELGEAVRHVLLDHRHAGMSRTAEMLLYMAARAQMVEEIIRPALNAGKVVVSDRYLLANVVYQGHAGGLDVASVWEVGRLATGGLMPDLTIVLDVPPEAASSRLNRVLDRMESQGDDFRACLRKGFADEAAANSKEIQLINAARPIEALHEEIRKIVVGLMETKEPDARIR